MKDKVIRNVSFLCGIMIYSLIHWTFPLIFGETPVNILRFDSPVGLRNYTINVFSYFILTLLVIIILIVLQHKKMRSFLESLLGIVVSIIMNALFISFMLRGF
ncbi:hypothetical protein I5677_13780 [Mobilitalea sibirica]|uniref:Uncharacterized protein n=1 Tax=Mobilitalea sibirica TaxID=1462919 RepID=A0A8J7HCD8_9FIRM|nr:hypothetical protein [Mobilitalea sibirica]MBH1941966.1 hypothetical protein [Mobilitalea sibirica]